MAQLTHAESQHPTPQEGARQDHPTPKATGTCHNCGIPVDDRIVWCSAFCDTEWHFQRDRGLYAAGR